MTLLDGVLPRAEQPSRWRRRLVNATIVATPLLVGGAIGALTIDGLRAWYPTIQRPAWNPPGWVFGPVWTTLYLMMGVALVQVVRTEEDRLARQVGLGLFALQLVLNFGWSWIFFVNHDLGGALVEIFALWVSIAATMAAFATVSQRAAGLLVPYLAWTTFATFLTASIWRLNR